MTEVGAQQYQRNLVAWVLVAFSISGLAIVTTGASAHADTSSAVTKSGTGEFSGLQVTVAQTEHLKDEVVRVSWTGAKPTSGSFDVNYMQVMQCWGDGPVPLRDNCEFGAFGNSGDQRGGPGVTTRAVTDPQYPDPAEPLKPPAGSFSPAIVPFAAVTGASSSAVPNPFFDKFTTNEQPFGRTGADGTGQAFFEVQTGALAPGLGCGQPEADGSTRNCWLVVVPRGTTEVDGTRPPQLAQLETSPLSQTNWKNAISFRLNFDPLAVSCPIGSSEHHLIGQEPAIEVVSSWQPALCGAVGSPFSYTKATDDVARRQTQQSDPWMALVSKPVDASVTGGRRQVYAPVALGAIGVAFNIDVLPKFGARTPQSVREQAGQRVESLKLNARLLAKLLTQSYWAASRMATFPPHNAEDLTRDPEFISLNPDFANYQFTTDIYQVLVPEGLADAYNEVWQWIAADPDANAFMSGTADPWGMVVNPNYSTTASADHRAFSLDRNDFPRADLVCRPNLPYKPVCPADLLAYAADFHDATRAASRGDWLARTIWDINKIPPQYNRPALQLSGARDVITLTDAATAARYSLPMAALKNAAGEFVKPDNYHVLAGFSAMTASSTPGVLVPNPGSSGSGIYPLTHLTYAVTAPDHLTADEATAYSKFLTYVAGPGQVPGIGQGQLPAGYVPLPASLVAQTKAAAANIAAGPQPEASPSDSADAPTGGSAPTVASSSGNSIPGLGGTTAAPVPVAVPAAAPGATPAAKPAGTAVAAPASFTTPNDLSNGSRFAIILALSFSLAAGLAWLIFPLLARRGPPAT